jgi:cytidylate kinase
MQKKHIITISGKPGSGKSSTSDKVAELLSYTRFSSGDMVRKMIERKNLTLAEFNEKAVTDHSLDHEIDEFLRKLRDKNDIVVDSRLGFYWIPESFKVFLELDMDVATARIFSDTTENENRKQEIGISSSVQDISKKVQDRVKNEVSRYRSLYGVDPYNTKHFDLVINTSRHSPQTVALTIFDHYRSWLNSDTWKQVYSEIPLGYSFKNSY